VFPCLLSAVPSTAKATEHSVHEHTGAKELLNKIMELKDANSDEFKNLVADLEKASFQKTLN
jgi:Zn-finger protein